MGYGVTGSLPRDNGLFLDGREIAENSPSGGFATRLTRLANPDLKWEEKAETNFGVEFSTPRLSATLDIYSRDFKGFILINDIDATGFGIADQYQNAGRINTKGVEFSVNYDILQGEDIKYNAGLVLSSYESVLEDYLTPREVRSNLGAPGQNDTPLIRVFVGEPIGQIWGPVFDGVSDGNPIFKDLNGDGVIDTDSGNALNDDVDFAVLGNGIPDFELGWTNQLSMGDWSFNAFFRAAFGHSLVNAFRAFYEPRLASQSSYNYVTTDLAVEGLTTARFSSLYVEKADFFKLDNASVNYTFDTSSWEGIDGLSLSLNGQNLFVISSYTGLDPEPAIQDAGTQDNGGDASNFQNPDVLSPGIDRRTNYFAARTFTLGVNLKF